MNLDIKLWATHILYFRGFLEQFTAITYKSENIKNYQKLFGIYTGKLFFTFLLWCVDLITNIV